MISPHQIQAVGVYLLGCRTHCASRICSDADPCSDAKSQKLRVAGAKCTALHLGQTGCRANLNHRFERLEPPVDATLLTIKRVKLVQRPLMSVNCAVMAGVLDPRDIVASPQKLWI